MRAFCAGEYVLMSLAEHISRPFPVLARLALLLRNLPVVRFVFAKFTPLPRRDIQRGESLERLILARTPAGATDTVEPVAVLEALDDIAIAAIAEPKTIAEPKPDDRSEREKLIRRRWKETGIKMWNPGVSGGGRAALKIQGRVGVLPVKPGQSLPRYDTLEFKLIEGRIVCEGVVVDPPKRRR
jgi:hypothetical protein